VTGWGEQGGRREPLADRAPGEPHPGRLSPAHPRRAEILAAHAAACARGDAGYRDPDTGLFVLTAVFLAARDRCCTNGCRHCPYVGAARA
jgi:hypothetical protein